jgi:hypothetical protein
MLSLDEDIQKHLLITSGEVSLWSNFGYTRLLEGIMLT